MIANLPLLFSNGNPTALTDIGAEDLEKFITFIVTCSWGHDTVKEVRKPPWWPGDVAFSHPFVRPRVVPKNWEARLRNLVKKCYDYHKSAFLLAFSAQLARYPRHRLRYVDNRDQTTSLYHRSNGKLLVTFRNENIFYDAAVKKDMCFQGKSTDIYLCDNCDSHFDNLNTLKAHERLCNNEILPTGTCSGGLNEFLSALKLQAVGGSDDGQIKTSAGDNEIKSKNIRTAANVDRGPPYPFSSLAYTRNTKSVQRDSTYSREKIERYCCTSTPISKSVGSKGKQQFPVKYRRPIDYWNRTHRFPNQRNKKILDIEGQILMLKCRPITVDVERMSIDSIKEYIDDMKKKSEQLVDKDIIYVDNIESDQPADVEMKISDPLKRMDNDCEVIDLCSDDESQSVNENCDPRAGVTCVMRGGAVLRRTAATPHSLPAEPCGARQKPLLSAVLQPHPVILIAHTLNSLQTISLD